MITTFVKMLNTEIRDGIKSTFLNEGYFTTCEYNYQSEVHSRLLSLITKVCFNMGFDIEIERGFNYSINKETVRFKPDITIYKKKKLVAFIEYESTNSSDARFYDMSRGTSDLRCIKYYGSDLTKNIPKYWIVISTLPKCKVDSKSWKSYEYLKSSKEFQDLTKSPFDFYFPKYIKETEKLFNRKKIYSDLILMNINKTKLKVEYKATKSYVA